MEVELNQSVLNTLSNERRIRKKLESEMEIRRSRVLWLEGLASDWSFKERTKWKEGIPELSSWREVWTEEILLEGEAWQREKEEGEIG